MRRKISISIFLVVISIVFCSGIASADPIAMNNGAVIEATNGNSIDNVIANKNQTAYQTGSYQPGVTDPDELSTGKYLPVCDDGNEKCETQILRVYDVK